MTKHAIGCFFFFKPRSDFPPPTKKLSPLCLQHTVHTTQAYTLGNRITLLLCLHDRKKKTNKKSYFDLSLFSSIFFPPAQLLTLSHQLVLRT